MLDIRKMPRQDTVPAAIIGDEKVVSLVANMIGVGEVYELFSEKYNSMSLIAIGRHCQKEIASILGTIAYLDDEEHMPLEFFATECNNIPWNETFDCSERIYDLPFDISKYENLSGEISGKAGFRAVDTIGATCRKMKYIDKRSANKKGYELPRKKLSEILEWLFFIENDRIKELFNLDSEYKKIIIGERQARDAMRSMEQKKQAFASMFL